MIHQWINIITESQTALSAVTNPKITSYLVCECPEELGVLGDSNILTLSYVPEYSGIRENDKPEECASTDHQLYTVVLVQ